MTVPATTHSGPQSRILRWIDYRLPFYAAIEHEFTGYPTPRNLSYCLPRSTWPQPGAW